VIEKVSTRCTIFEFEGNKKMEKSFRVFFIYGWILAMIAFPACAQKKGNEITLGAYTAPREAYQAIIPFFQKYWQGKTGKPIEVKQSYLGSGAQARAIVGGFEADLAALSLESDIEVIQKAGLIKNDWRKNNSLGMVTRSIVILAVRAGNPKNIHDWQDLAKPGIEILTPNPKSSGGAMWNILALYGAAQRGKVPGYEASSQGARNLLKDVFKNVTVLDKGARESIINFEKGIGDVVITYESEVLVGKKSGQNYEAVTPSSTILIETPLAVVDGYAGPHGALAPAQGFRDFLWSREAQKIFADFGLRPVNPEVAAEVSSQFPAPADLWTVGNLGGWGQVIPGIFGPGGIFTAVMEEIEKEK